MAVKIYSCENSRGVRPIWTAEEMGLDYELIMMPFPPRVFMKEYLETNILGTVPFMVDGSIKMTESVAISQYLVEKYGFEKELDILGFSMGGLIGRYWIKKFEGYKMKGTIC